MTLDLEERVEIGVQFLDDTRPDWRDYISVEYLRMSSCSSCVLGQVFGWDEGVEALYEWSITHPIPELSRPLDDIAAIYEVAGFESSGDITYADLQHAWERVIANEPECDGCDQDPWRAAVHYGTCPLNINNNLIGRNA